MYCQVETSAGIDCNNKQIDKNIHNQYSIPLVTSFAHTPCLDNNNIITVDLNCKQLITVVIIVNLLIFYRAWYVY